MAATKKRGARKGTSAPKGAAKKGGARKGASGRKSTAKKRGSGKRELLDTKRGGKRFARRTASGRFSEQDEVGRSLSQDRKRRAKKTAKSGQGDKGDRKRSSTKRRSSSKSR